jgi:hypothetical protein
MRGQAYVIFGCDGPSLLGKVVWAGRDLLAAEQEFAGRIESPCPGWPWYRLTGSNIPLQEVRSSHWRGLGLPTSRAASG